MRGLFINHKHTHSKHCFTQCRKNCGTATLWPWQGARSVSVLGWWVEVGDRVTGWQGVYVCEVYCFVVVDVVFQGCRLKNRTGTNILNHSCEWHVKTSCATEKKFHISPKQKSHCRDEITAEISTVGVGHSSREKVWMMVDPVFTTHGVYMSNKQLNLYWDKLRFINQLKDQIVLSGHAQYFMFNRWCHWQFHIFC